MPRNEYKIVSALTNGRAEQTLKQMDEEGWDLVSFQIEGVDQSRTMHMIFKRPAK